MYRTYKTYRNYKCSCGGEFDNPYMENIQEESSTRIRKLCPFCRREMKIGSRTFSKEKQTCIKEKEGKVDGWNIWNN